MVDKKRDRLTTEVDENLLVDVRRLAERESRTMQSLVEEALSDLLLKRFPDNPRHHVMAAYQRSLARYGELYRKLAK